MDGRDVQLSAGLNGFSLMRAWYGASWHPLVLTNPSLDLAVALGSVCEVPSSCAASTPMWRLRVVASPCM